jgi:hypothetical protein
MIAGLQGHLQPNAQISQLKYPVLSALYNTVQMAKQDGYHVTIGAGTNGKHDGPSHYAGEAVDLAFQDSKGNWLPDGQQLELGNKYGLAAGWGEMRDEWTKGNQPNPNNAHLHFDWTKGAGGPGDQAVTVFRKRDPADPNSYLPFTVDTASKDQKTPPPKGLPDVGDNIALAVGVTPSVFSRLVQAESNWNPKAVSSTGAFGLTQLMPATAQEIARQHGWSMADLQASPSLQLRAGAEYYKQMLQKFNGNEAQALAAYNMGPAGLQQVLDGKKGLPAETSQYVYKILSPIDPSINTKQDSDGNVLHGLGLKWAPQQEHQAAQAVQQQVQGVASNLFSRFTGSNNPSLTGQIGELLGNMQGSYNDPTNPSSPLYQKSQWLPTGDKGADQDYITGTANQFADFAQDIAGAATMHLVPKSSRGTAIESYLQGHGLLGFAAGEASNFIGGAALYEAAMAKLIGSAGGIVGGLKTAAGAIPETPGLLNAVAGTLPSKAYQSMLALGGVGFVDGSVSSMADWLRGQGPMADRPLMDAAGHSFYQGVMSGLTGMAMMGAGTVLQQSVLPVVGGTLRGLGAAGSYLADSGHSLPAQAAFAGILGGGASSVTAALSNVSGASQQFLGGDIPIPEAFASGVAGGSLMAPFARVLPNRLGEKATGFTKALGLGPLQEALHAKAVQILGANPELVQWNIDQAMKSLSTTTNGEAMAAGQTAVDMIGQHVARLQAAMKPLEDQMGQQASSVHQTASAIKPLANVIQAYETGTPAAKGTIGTPPQYPLDVQAYKTHALQMATAQDTYDRATQAFQAAPPGTPPDQTQPLERAVNSAGKSLLAANKAMQDFLVQNPHMKVYGNAVEQLKILEPQLQQKQSRLQATQADVAAKKPGWDNMVAAAQHVQKTIQDGMASWQALNPEGNTDPSSALQFVGNKLLESTQAPVQHDTIWNRDLAGTGWEKYDTPEGKQFLNTAYQRFRENFAYETIRALDRANDFPTKLDQMTNALVKAWDPSAENGRATGIGPQIDSYAKETREALEFLQGQWGGQSRPMPLRAGEEGQPWEKTRRALLDGKIRYDIPDLLTKTNAKGVETRLPNQVKAIRDYTDGVMAYPTADIMTPQTLAESLGVTPKISPDGFFQRLGQTGVSEIPTIKTPDDFQGWLAHAKAAQMLGQDFVPFRGDKDVFNKLLTDHLESLKPASAKVAEIYKALGDYHQTVRDTPLAQRPSLDISRWQNPDYILNNIHESWHQLGQVDEITKAVQTGDKQVIAQALKNNGDLLQAQLTDLTLTQREIAGVGKFNMDKNSQPVVANSEYGNRAAGLENVARLPALDAIVNLVSAPGEATIRTVDNAKRLQGVQYANARNEIKLGEEGLRTIMNGPMEGRSPGDITGLSQILFGQNIYARRQAYNYIADRIIAPYEQLIREASGEIKGDRSKEEWSQLKGRGYSPDNFKKDLVAVSEDPSKAQAFFGKYGDKGKQALYYTNKIKGVFETLTSGNPDMANYMRANWMAASFPKATDHWLKTHASGGSSLATGLSSENLRDFTTRESFQKHIQSLKDRVTGAGFTLETFKNMDLNDRIDAIHASDARNGMSAEDLYQDDRPRWDKLAAETERISNADLYDMTDDDPVSIFRRQIHSIMRAQETRQFFNTLSNTKVDIGGGTTPTMRGLIHVMATGQDVPIMKYRDGSTAAYKVLDGVPGFERYSSSIGGEDVSASRLAINPEAFDFLTRTALQDPSSFTTKPVASAWKRLVSTIKSYSLMGGFLPHWRNNMVMRAGDMIMAPLRAFAADEAGRNLMDSANRNYQLATFNAIRSGVNMRTIQQASRGVMQSMIDQMDPATAHRLYGVADDKVNQFLQAMNINDPMQKQAYNQLGGLGKFCADVLGAPVTLDHIMMREAAHKNIQAGMIGGFYRQREIFAQTHQEYLGTLSPEARNQALDQMASQVVNAKASAIPFYMQNTAFRELVGNTFMSPNWLMAKVNMMIDSLDAGLGLGQMAKGPLSPDAVEISTLLKKAGVSERRYSGYSPEIKQAIRSRMAATVGGTMFASFVGLQVAQAMMSGTNTWTDRAPDKWTSLKMGDGRYLSGLMGGNVKDFVDIACQAVGAGPSPALEKVKQILERNLLPTDRAVAELYENKDATGKPIYGDYRDDPTHGGAFARDMAGYLVKSFVNFDDTAGFKTNTQLSDMFGNTLAGPGGVAPNSLTGKEYLLRALGMYDAKDNWAASQSADLQHRQNFYKQDLERRIQPYFDSAKMEQNPEKRQALIQAAWAQATAGLPILDKELSRYSPGGVYRMDQKQFTAALLRTLNPEGWAAMQRRTDAAGLAFQGKEMQHNAGEGAQ